MKRILNYRPGNSIRNANHFRHRWVVCWYVCWLPEFLIFHRCESVINTWQVECDAVLAWRRRRCRYHLTISSDSSQCGLFLVSSRSALSNRNRIVVVSHWWESISRLWSKSHRVHALFHNISMIRNRFDGWRNLNVLRRPNGKSISSAKCVWDCRQKCSRCVSSHSSLSFIRIRAVPFNFSLPFTLQFSFMTLIWATDVASNPARHYDHSIVGNSFSFLVFLIPFACRECVAAVMIARKTCVGQGPTRRVFACSQSICMWNTRRLWIAKKSNAIRCATLETF